MDLLVIWLQGIQGGAAVLGLAVLLLVEHLHPFFEFFRESRRDWSAHLFRNLGLALLNGIVVAMVFAGVWVAASMWAVGRGFGLMNWLTSVADIPYWLHAVGAILLFDVWTYTWHRLNHRIPFFWRFHRVHHADATMDVTTAGRFHFGEIILSSILRVPVIVFIGMFWWEIILYETMMLAVVQFHHANIALPPSVDRVLRMFIVTPAMHKVHHSRLRLETDSNYSAFLSIWDRLFQSFRHRPDLDAIEFGLDEFDEPDDRTISGLITMPLKERKRTTSA